MSMRSGASVCQLFAVSSVPRRRGRCGGRRCRWSGGAVVMFRSHTRRRGAGTTDVAWRASGIPPEHVPRPAAAARGQPSWTPRAAMNGTASTADPSMRTSKCRWHPVEAPVLPTAPMRVARGDLLPLGDEDAAGPQVRVAGRHARAVVDEDPVAVGAVRAGRDDHARRSRRRRRCRTGRPRRCRGGTSLTPASGLTGRGPYPSVMLTARTGEAQPCSLSWPESDGRLSKTATSSAEPAGEPR